MKVYIGSDHNGFNLKRSLHDFLRTNNYDFEDEGDGQLNPVDDYPLFAAKVVNAIKADGRPDARGILICGSGQGMCMAANRFKGIRACLAWDVESARSARNDDDSNVICIPARIITKDQTFSIVKTFLDTPFAHAPRFARRIVEMDNLG